MQITITTDNGDQITFDLLEKTFSSGNIGFFANGKIEIDGKRYQCTFILTKLKQK